MANYTAKITLSFPVDAETPADAWRIAHYSAIAFVNGNDNASELLQDYGNVEQPEYNYIDDGGVQIFDEQGTTLLVDGNSQTAGQGDEDIEPQVSTEPEDLEKAVPTDEEEKPDSE